jgi:hypothetical protein
MTTISSAYCNRAPHEYWTLATCSWIGKGNDPSYNSATTFDTFPFPWPPGAEFSEAEDTGFEKVKAIADAARSSALSRIDPGPLSKSDPPDR